jgi:hypothetical protein
MKYLLINSVTKEEYLCEKAAVDGFDYYVCFIPDMLPDTKYKTIVENRRRIVEYSRHIQSTDKSIIATNNPSGDLPKVLNIRELAYEYYKQHEPSVYAKYFKLRNHQALEREKYNQDKEYLIQSFISGYNKSQETHPFSETDMIQFAEWLNVKEYMLIDSSWYHMGHWTNLSTKNLLDMWKEQRTQTIYFK